MVWSWSHSSDAYESLRNHIAMQDAEWIAVVMAEWDAWDGDTFNPQMDSAKYEVALKEHKETIAKIGTEHLAEAIYEKASELATCENGGFEAWCCPFGCGCHCLTFDCPGENQEFEPDPDNKPKDLDDASKAVRRDIWAVKVREGGTWCYSFMTKDHTQAINFKNMQLQQRVHKNDVKIVHPKQWVVDGYVAANGQYSNAVHLND